MLRSVFLVIITIIFLTGNMAWAQNNDGGGTNPPRGDGDRNWCTVAPRVVPAGQYECGFSSPTAACAFQVSTSYPLGRYSPTGSQRDTDTTADCFRQENVGIIEFNIGLAGVVRLCESGFHRVGETCQAIQFPASCSQCTATGGSPDAKHGNPINIITGAKTQSVTDFSTADGRMSVKRFYNSAPYGDTLGFYKTRINLGSNWALSTHPTILLGAAFDYNGEINLLMPEGFGFNHKATLVNPQVYTTVRAYAGGGGEEYSIAFEDNVAYPAGKVSRQLAITKYDGTIYHYVTPAFESSSSSSGLLARLVSIEYPGGYSQSYSYTSSDRVSAITDSFGRQITFEYNTIIWQKFDAFGVVEEEIYDEDGVTVRDPWSSTLKKTTFPDGTYMEYEYDSFSDFEIKWDVQERLISASKYNADDSLIQTESYHYEDERFPYALTGITDASGIRYASWEYDGFTRAISSVHAGNVDETLVEYDIPTPSLTTRSSRMVTNALGRDTTYEIGNFFERFAILSVEGQASANAVPDVKTINYSNEMVSEIIDKEGRTHRYVRDIKGRILSMTRAFGTAEETTTTTTWHTVYRLPLQTVAPGLTTDYVYDGQGRLLSMTQTDTSPDPSTPRSWNYTYSGVNVASINGPLPGASDTQFFAYAGPNLTSVTNELGHVVQITSHNPVGAPAAFTDANGVITRLLYDERHRLTAIIEDDIGEDATTQIAYNATDQVTKITPPNGAFLRFFYDGARRLMAIENAAGERIDYTRNAMGGIVRTDVSGAGGTAEFTLSQVTDELGRVISRIGAGPSAGGLATTQLAYDREDNLTAITDARNNGWTQSYDGLNRLVKEIDPEGGEVDYTLAAQADIRNPLSAVQDARGATTNYIRNGYGELIREVSLEAGTTHYVRDERGLITQMTNGRGVVSDYSYDAAGRLLSVSYPASPADDIAYTYDEGAFGKGQLTTVAENFGVTTYSYNSLGFMTGMIREIGGQAYATSYTYDKAGEVLSTAYPSGRIVEVARDAAARITAMTTRASAGATPVPVLSGLTYAAFGPLKTAGFGDGHSLNIAYDTAYRATSLQRSSGNGALMDIGFDYDAVGDILAMNDNLRPERSQSFAYDKVSRLTSASGGFGDEGYGSISYGYNLGGDRTSRDWLAPANDGSGDMTLSEELYIYENATLRLTEVTSNGSPLRQLGYAPSGQVISDTRTDASGTETPYTYGLNARGRVTSVTRNGGEIASYLYDESEQRISKTPEDGMPIHYHYDSEGRLISETDGDTGATQREYIWLGLTPVAIYDAANDNDTCDEDLLATLNERLLARQDRLAVVTERIAIVSGNLDTRTAREATVAARKAELEAILAGVNPNNTARIARLTERIATLETRLETIGGAIIRLTDRLETLNARVVTLGAAIARITARIARVQGRCDAGTGGGTSTAQLYFLHADHLGRPAFATDGAGSVVWDGGITTPFGESIATAAAFAQNLMFPGQYQDAETGLSHNWHRTYDPTLGRYLQSDPIGLAGGLNRYAYVGGNPVSYVDPMGLDGTLTIYSSDTHSFTGFCPTLPDPDGKTECETRSMWPTDETVWNPFDNSDKGPRTENDGLDNPSNPRYSRLSVRIGNDGERRYKQRVNSWQNRGYTPFGSACTHFSLDIWNAASDRPLYPQTFLPQAFKKEIERQNSRP